MDRHQSLSSPSSASLTMTAVTATAVAGVVAVLFALPWAMIYYSTGFIFDHFIQRSIEDDLSKIDQVYKTTTAAAATASASADDDYKHDGRRGAFLVATIQSSSKDGTKNTIPTIVGCVGGEPKSSRPRSDGNADTAEKDEPQHHHHPHHHHEHSIELRRMVVDPKYHGRGIGKKLVRALEDHLMYGRSNGNGGSVGTEDIASERDQQHYYPRPTRMFLTCSSYQPAAHSLYESCGFQLKRIFDVPNLPYVLRHSFRIREYEKIYLPQSPPTNVISK